MPCFVERTGFTGGQAVAQAVPSAAASGAGVGTLYSRRRGPTTDPMVVGRRRDTLDRIEIPVDGSSNHITQYDPNSLYRVSWNVSAAGDDHVHYNNEGVHRKHPDRHKPPPGYSAS